MTSSRVLSILYSWSSVLVSTGGHRSKRLSRVFENRPPASSRGPSGAAAAHRSCYRCGRSSTNFDVRAAMRFPQD